MTTKHINNSRMREDQKWESKWEGKELKPEGEKINWREIVKMIF